MAAAANRIEIDLIARDLVSGVLDRLRNNLGVLDDKASLFRSTFMANLATQGIDLALNKLRDLGSAISDAAKIQTTLKATSSDIGTNLGIGFQDAQKIVEETNQSIAKMAAALPGATKDYNAVFNSVGSAIAKQFKGDTEGFKEVSQDITKRVGVLASIRNIDAGQSGSVIERLLSGNGGFGELALNDILQKNAVFKQALIDGMKSLGADQKDWQKLSAEMRLKIVRQALTVATPDSLIDSFNGTVDSMLESIKSNLFDPMIGTFGMLRKIPEADGRTVLDAVQGFLTSFLAFSESIGSLGKKLGISVDPLVPLVNIIDFLADLASAAAGLFDGDPQDILNNIFKGFNSGLNGVLNGLKDLDTSKLGQMLASGVNGIFNGLVQTINRIDWFAVGRMLPLAILRVFQFLDSFLKNLDWLAVARGFLTIIWGIIRLFGGILVGVFEALGEVVRKHLEATIKDPLERAGRTITSVWDAIVTFFKGIYDKVTGWLSQVSDMLKPANLAQSAVSTISNTVSSVVPEPVKDVAKNVLGTISGIFNGNKKPSEVNKGNTQNNHQNTNNVHNNTVDNTRVNSTQNDNRSSTQSTLNDVKNNHDNRVNNLSNISNDNRTSSNILNRTFAPVSNRSVINRPTLTKYQNLSKVSNNNLRQDLVAPKIDPVPVNVALVTTERSPVVSLGSPTATLEKPRTSELPQVAPQSLPNVTNNTEGNRNQTINFNPQMTINAPQGIDNNQVAQIVLDRLASEYRAFTRGQIG